MGLSTVICRTNVVPHRLYVIVSRYERVTDKFEQPQDDSAAHISEEVRNAARVAPFAILTSVALVGSMGWILLIAASFATTSVPALFETDVALPFGQLLLDVLGKKGMLTIWSLTLIAQVCLCLSHCLLLNLLSRASLMSSSSAARLKESTHHASYSHLRETTRCLDLVCGRRSTVIHRHQSMRSGSSLSSQVYVVYLDSPQQRSLLSQGNPLDVLCLSFTHSSRYTEPQSLGCTRPTQLRYSCV